MRTISLSLALLCTLAAGCVAPVFHEPTTISTQSIAAHDVKKLEPVRATSTNVFFILLPIPVDPRDLYDDLLAEARSVGGNAVIDVQVRSSSVYGWALPVIVFDTIEATGMAAIIE